MTQKETRPGSLKWWITLIIAILTAIAGMLTEAKTSAMATALDGVAVTQTKKIPNTMAKGKNMLGKFRGKVGATVFRTEAGIGQIASEYNPNPKNPRTIAQTRQRGKMNLAGQLSKLTPSAALIGLDSNKRMARGKFVSNILKNTTMPATLSTSQANNATLDESKLKLSNGLFRNISGNFTQAGAVIEMGWSGLDAYDDIVGVLCVVYYNDGQRFSACKVENVTITDPATADPLEIDVTGWNGGSVVVYGIPVIATDENIMATYNNLVSEVNGTNNSFASAVMASLKEQGALGESVLLGRQAIAA